MKGIQQTCRRLLRISFSPIFLALACFQQTGAQTLDSFNPGASNWVYATVVQPDGRIVVGGEFTNIVGQSRNYLARLNPDGSLDASFNPRASNAVNCLALQPDGKILVGGTFTGIGGQSRGRIARLNPDGSVDVGFNPNANSTVNCLAIQPDGKILIGGSFNFLGGQPWNRLARLESSGALDASFSPNPSNTVNCVALQPDGKILVAGSFAGIGGQLRSRIARLNTDGNPDGFNPGVSSTPFSLVVQPDGKILVGGSFNTLAGQSRSRLGRLNEDGSPDFSFDPGASGAVNSLALQADGKILVGGTFTTLAGQPCDRVGRLNENGSFDFSFSSSASNTVHSLAVQADGRILVGGRFITLSGQPRNYLGRLNNTDSADESLNYDGTSITWMRSGTAPEVWRASFDASTNGTTWIELEEAARITGGWLTPSSLPLNATIRARGFLTGGQNNGSCWPIEASIGPPAVVSQPESRTNNAGTEAVFTTAFVGGSPLWYQWRKHGTNLTSGGSVSGSQTPTLTLNNVFGADAGEYSLVVSNATASVTSSVAVLTVVDPLITSQPISQAVETGQTASFAVMEIGTAPSYQWRKGDVNIPGAIGPSLVISNTQRADAGLYDVVVSNSFSSVTSATVMLSVNLASLDAWNPGALNGVNSTVIQSDGKIFVAGDFNTLGGISSPRYGRLNTDGTPDLSFSPLNGLVDYYGSYDSVRCLALQEDGNLLIAGAFHFRQGGAQAVSYDSFLRLTPNGTFDQSVPPGLNIGDTVFAQALEANGKILIAGNFASLKGQARVNLAACRT
jgi:uncharacterized delta-60 repeat protein